MLALPLFVLTPVSVSFSDLSLCVPVPPSPHLLTASSSSLSLPRLLPVSFFICRLSLPWFLPLCDPVPLFLLGASSGDSGNWIEIAYGTSSGGVRVIVQHPETVGSGPQLFQTFTVHRSPVTKIMLSEKHLISGGLVGCPSAHFLQEGWLRWEHEARQMRVSTGERHGVGRELHRGEKFGLGQSSQKSEDTL